MSKTGNKTGKQHIGAAPSPWSVPLAMVEVSETGRHEDFVADAQTREAVAAFAGLVGVPRLQASFDLSRHGADGLQVKGRVSATIVQTCVVTLDPVENEVVEDIDLVFLPKTRPAAGAEHYVDAETDDVDTDADNSSEFFAGGAVDLGAIATEFLILGIDPYPRKPGAEFQSLRADDSAARPFAALAALKDRQRERKS